MSLTGTLEDTYIGNLLQLLTSEGKSGRMVLSSYSGTGLIVLRHGKIIYAASNSAREALGHLLVCQGLISTEELEACLEVQHNSNRERRLGTILVESGVLEEETLRRIITEQLHEVLAELLGWKKGFYRFEEEDLPYLGEIEVDASDFLLDGHAMQGTLLEDIETPTTDQESADVAEESTAGGEVLADRDMTATAKEPADVAEEPTPDGEVFADLDVPTTDGESAEVADESTADGEVFADLDLPATDEEPAELTERSTAEGEVFTDLDLPATDEESSAVQRHDDRPDPTVEDADAETGGDREEAMSHADYLGNLRTIMTSLHAPLFLGEITSEILNYARKVVSRGALFSTGRLGFTGLSQFGVEPPEAGTADFIRGVTLPSSGDSILREVMTRKTVFKGPLEESPVNLRLIETLGGSWPTEVVAAPLLVSGRVLLVLYGDNSLSGEPIDGVDELQLVMLHAGIVMEKNLLAKRVEHLEALRATGAKAVEPEKYGEDEKPDGDAKPSRDKKSDADSFWD